jgi:two-component system cell cycle response regulator
MDFVSSSAGETGRVIVAEANPVTAGALSWLLREQGYTVTTVANRDALFAVLERYIPDLVLIGHDILEPDGSVLGRLRADERWHDVRVIVTAPWSAIEGGNVPWGADDCVTEPLRVPELLGRVRTQIRASGQLRSAHVALRDTTSELQRARDDAVSNRRLVDILHEITGELSPSEIYQLLARRVAETLVISHCSVVLARPEDSFGTIAASYEDPGAADGTLPLDEYPEVRAALDSGRPVLVEDAGTHPLYAGVRASSSGTRRIIDMSSAAVPFSIDRVRSGVLFLRTDRSQRTLTMDDVVFCEVVIRAAVAAIRRAQALETTRAENRRLEALATTDPLTRVLNRRALLDRLNTEVDRARRYNSSLTLLLLDLDHFKQINDTAGHLAGDSVLRQIGELLEEAIRKVDIVARYGGEEFVVILPETVVEGGVAFAERLRERIALQSFDVGAGRTVNLTVSIGIASFPSPLVASTEDLFARADEALYRAKSAGRNQVQA